MAILYSGAGRFVEPFCIHDRLEALGIHVRRHGTGTHRAPCPRCDRGPRDDALSVTLYDDHALWLCHRCGWRGVVRSRDRPVDRHGRPPPRQAPAPQPKAADDDAAKLAICRRILGQSRPARGTLVEIYLQSRGLALPSGTPLRFHARLSYWDDDVLVGHYPAMVAPAVDPLTGALSGIHRTFLRSDGCGKASVPAPKKLLGRWGVIRLAADEEIGNGLGLAEGIETALALINAGWAPIWCCLSADGFTKTPPIPGIDRAVFFSDHDPTGIRAAQEAREQWRLAGVTEVQAVMPPTPDQDWLDYARELQL